jgi:hypothetical protein
MGVKHDRAVFDITVLLEEAGDVSFREARVDSGDEEIRAGVDGLIVSILHAGVGWRRRRSVTAVGRSATVAVIPISSR